jgi:hypothetical protein
MLCSAITPCWHLSRLPLPAQLESSRNLTWARASHTDRHFGLTQSLAQSLPFLKVKHQVSTLDAQPSGEHGGILILVTGALLVCSWQRSRHVLASVRWLNISYRSMKSRDPWTTVKPSNSYPMVKVVILFSTTSSSWFSDERASCSWLARLGTYRGWEIGIVFARIIPNP